MRAVDTNILVRLFMADDEAQFAAVTALFRENDIHIPVTVLLEAEWMLRRVYRQQRKEILDCFRRLAGLSNVELENADRIALAIDMAEKGVDFADSLHLVRCIDCTDFVTFDKALAAASGNVTLLNA